MTEQPRARSRWHWSLFVAASLLGLNIGCGLATAAPTTVKPWQRWQTIMRTRPQREEHRLRDTNIADTEIEQIRQAIRARLPDALVNIGAVTVGCPCEDGPACTEQVWVVAERPEQSTGLQMSRINGKWQIGPLQHWWLDYTALFHPQHAQPSSRQRQLNWRKARAELTERFPFCKQSMP